MYTRMRAIDRSHMLLMHRVSIYYNWFGRVRSVILTDDTTHTTHTHIHYYIHIWIAKPPKRCVHGEHEPASKEFNWCHQKLIYSIEPYLASVMLTFIYEYTIYFSLYMHNVCVRVRVFLFSNLQFFEIYLLTCKMLTFKKNLRWWENEMANKNEMT